MWGGGVCQGFCRRDLKDYVRLRESAYGSGRGVLSASYRWAAASVPVLKGGRSWFDGR